MNKERLSKLADWLEAGAPHEHVEFDMGSFLGLTDANGNMTQNVKEACGSLCCIAGCAAQFFAPDELVAAIEIGGVGYNVLHIATKALDLDMKDARLLFLPPTNDLAYVGYSYDNITPKMAAKVIRHLIKTGKVDWRVISK